MSYTLSGGRLDDTSSYAASFAFWASSNCHKVCNARFVPRTLIISRFFNAGSIMINTLTTSQSQSQNVFIHTTSRRQVSLGFSLLKQEAITVVPGGLSQQGWVQLQGLGPRHQAEGTAAGERQVLVSCPHLEPAAKLYSR